MSLKRSVFMGSLTFFICLFSIVLVSPVSAAVPEIETPLENWNHTNGWARWSASADFHQGKPSGSMQIVIGHFNSNGDPVIDYDQSFPIDCTEVGSVLYTGHTIILDGKGYVECELYDFRMTVHEITQGQLDLPPYCHCYNPHASATVRTEGKGGYQNPIVYADAGMSFEMPISKLNGAARLAIDMDGYRFETDDFSRPNQMEHFYGEVGTQGGVSVPYFKSTYAYIGAGAPQIAGTPVMSTETSLMTIGFNPQTGELLIGEISDVFIDPFIMPRCC